MTRLELIDALNAKMRAMHPEERLAVLELLTAFFCRHCGYEFADRRRICHCQNEE